jgi:hypothetical protein
MKELRNKPRFSKDLNSLLTVDDLTTLPGSIGHKTVEKVIEAVKNSIKK